MGTGHLNSKRCFRLIPRREGLDLRERSINADL
jgi:hypothetical protein